MYNRNRRILAGLLCLCLILSQIPVTLVSATDSTVYIHTLQDFLTFAENCRLDSYSLGQTFVLTADIDLTGTKFDGIPVFCGTFDGGWHTITGLHIASAGSQKGLFRYVQDNAVVKNLAVTGTVLPTGGRNDVGGIAGSNAGHIENCSFQGEVAGNRNVGGIVGNNLPGAAVIGCTVMGSVSGKHFAGGIAGANAGTIQNGINRAGINVTVRQNSVDISDITLESLLDTESAMAATDIGGIAGYSEGVIRSCHNYGPVGYPHMGYNIGGIAGLQCGYVADCNNYAAICGRKEVGGIVGQQEPHILLRYDIDTLQILQLQFGELSALIDETADRSEKHAAAIKNILARMQRHMQAIDTASEYLQSVIQAPKLEDISEYLQALQTIRQSIAGMEDCLQQLLEATDTASADLEKDVQAISQKLAEIENTLNHSQDHLGGDLADVSDADTAADLTSKTENCHNHGAISGDLHVGGIVGSISFENDLDPEKDITVQGDATLHAAGHFRSVIRDCSNTAAVQVKTSHAGGIVGQMSMGLVHSCVSNGSLENPGADYVGGIAGESAGFLRNCMVRGILQGNRYVGGIGGTGSIVTDCLALVSVAGSEATGAILGLANQHSTQKEVPISGNFYLGYGQDPGAIDGISYTGQAEALQLEAFVQKAALFAQATVTFVANGEVVLRQQIPTGSAFTQIPAVPQLGGSTGVWDGIQQLDLSCVMFDLTIHARYIGNETVLAGNQTDGNGRPNLLLQGEFGLQAQVEVESAEEGVPLNAEQSLLQAWRFNVTQCLDLQAGRLLLPEGADGQQVILLVRDSQGNWNQRTFRRSDSYLVFSLEEGEDAIALVQAADRNDPLSILLWITGGSLAVFVLAIIWVISHRRKVRKQAHSAETTE